jgi:hypothetical protein
MRLLAVIVLWVGAVGCDSPRRGTPAVASDTATPAVALQPESALAALTPPFDSTGASAPQFEIGLWPGEGIPVIVAATDRLVLRKSPRVDAPLTDRIAVASNARITYDSTRFQTITPARLLATAAASITGRDLGDISFLSRERYYSTAFRDTTIAVSATTTIEYLQPRAEGTCFVRVEGRVIDANPCPTLDESRFQVDGEPTTRWWIHARSTSASGWLPVGEGTARVASRTF